jgi:putative spermidine/putrescine transport system substrate-binding protein
VRLTPLLAAGAALAALTLSTACGSSSPSDSVNSDGSLRPPKMTALSGLGPREGEVGLITWAGYAEDGSDDPRADWVHPFERRTGCKVDVKVAGTSDDMVRLMRTGQYDVVSAPGDASLRLIAAGDVAPVNTDLVPNYRDVFPALKLRAWNSAGGVAYGIPHGYGANLLMYRTDKVSPAPASWDAVFRADSPYRGRITAYDSPIYLADAALYLMRTRPSLGIRNPYALDQTQFDAAVALLRQQNAGIGEYWSDYLKEVSAFRGGDSVLGTGWQVTVDTARSERVPVAAVLPREGATGWSDTWMLSSRAEHPNCAYAWLDWIVSPQVNAQVAEYFGEAPANRLACGHTVGETFCADHHAGDSAYYRRVWFWTTPVPQCLDGRRNVTCVPYAQWVRAWASVKG